MSFHLVPVHELLADDVFTDAGRGHQVVQLVEELHTALVVLGSPLTQLPPQDQSYSLEQSLKRAKDGKKVSVRGTFRID